MRFTSEEIAQSLDLVLGLRLSAEEAAAPEKRTEGWIAGLQMAAISMRGRDDIAEFVRAFTGSQRYILDYLSEEVLWQQSRDVKMFLLQTAILDRLSGELCDAMIGAAESAESQSALEYLERSNLFVVPLDDERRWYRYHHLFATGPIFVGVPFLADTRYPEGVAALGMIMSAYGGGDFLGIVLAGVLPKPDRRLGIVLLALAATVAVDLALLGFAASTLVAVLIALVKGLAEGWILIQFTTWLQHRTARNMLGRMMSLLTFYTVALVPISNALSGILIKLSSEGLFVGAGILMLLTVIITAHSRAARSMGVEQGVDTIQAWPSFLSH